MDIIGPLPKTKSYNHNIIALVNYFSKWPEAMALPNKSAEQVSLFLYQTSILNLQLSNFFLHYIEETIQCI